MRPVRTDIAIVAAIATASMVLSVFGFNSALPRALLGGPLVLALPGYALAAALFPAWQYGRAVLMLLSLGLSLAIAAVGGVLLQITPAGIDTRSWALLLWGVTIVCCAIASRRGGTSSAAGATSEALLMTRSHLTMFGVAALLVGVSIWLARAPSPEAPDQAYSVLWAAPVPGSDNVVRLGVNSAERGTADYIVRVVDAGRDLQEFTFQLAPADVWETDVSLADVSDDTIEVQLSTADAPDQVYRRISVRTGG